MSKPFLRPRSGHSLFKSGSICIFVPELYDARILKGCQQSHPAQLFQPILVNFHFGSSSMATARGRGGGFGRRRSGRHARAAAETAGCRLGRRRSHRRPRTSAAPSTSSPLIGRQFEVSSLSVGLSAVSVGLVVESGRAIDLPSWPVSFRAVCACWASGFCHQSPQTGYWASHLLFAPLGRSAALFVRACWHDSSLESPL